MTPARKAAGGITLGLALTFGYIAAWHLAAAHPGWDAAREGGRVTAPAQHRFVPAGAAAEPRTPGPGFRPRR